jgi:hypothetical protein
MEIEKVGELLYPSNENRLNLCNGFSKKVQGNVKEFIEFYLNQHGNFLFAQQTKLHIVCILFCKGYFLLK